jgi:hypothetical protein
MLSKWQNSKLASCLNNANRLSNINLQNLKKGGNYVNRKKTQ